jgi:hypothetical protein
MFVMLYVLQLYRDERPEWLAPDCLERTLTIYTSRLGRHRSTSSESHVVQVASLMYSFTSSTRCMTRLRCVFVASIRNGLAGQCHERDILSRTQVKFGV